MIKSVLKNKKAISITLGTLILVIMGVAIFIHSGHSIGQIKVDFEGNKEMQWLSNDDIVNIVKPKIQPEGLSTSIYDVKPGEIKVILEQNPYIKRASVYVDANNDIHILIKQSEAIMRVFNNNHVGYYISSEGNILPLCSNFTPRVCVASGELLEKCQDIHKDALLLNTLFFVASKLNADTFMRSLSEEIVVDNYNNWLVIPKWGRARINFGDTSNWDDKILRLKAFYQNSVKDKRWHQYKIINLTYKGQVVCEKNDLTFERSHSNASDYLSKQDSSNISKSLNLKGQHKNNSGNLTNKQKNKHPILNNKQNMSSNE